ncbi:hypothetical protein D3C87_1791870 [compost metagenome]
MPGLPDKAGRTWRCSLSVQRVWGFPVPGCCIPPAAAANAKERSGCAGLCTEPEESLRNSLAGLLTTPQEKIRGYMQSFRIEDKE